MDIVFVILICIVAALLAFGFAALVFMTCRCIDRCLAKCHLFHHRRAYLSTKVVHFQSSPIIRQNPTILNQPPPSASQSVPSSPQPSLSRSSKQHVSFSHSDIPMAPLSPKVSRNAEVDALNASLGINLNHEQLLRLKSILQGTATGLENRNFQPSSNVYDMPPVDVDSSFSSASDVTQIEVPLIHQQSRPAVPQPTGNHPRPNLRSKPPRRYPPNARATRDDTEPAVLPVRYYSHYFFYSTIISDR
jgi:hypothetical protein